MMDRAAADLKFLQRLLQLRLGNFGSKSGTRITIFASALCFPKFV